MIKNRIGSLSSYLINIHPLEYSTMKRLANNNQHAIKENINRVLNHGFNVKVKKKSMKLKKKFFLKAVNIWIIKECIEF